MGHAPFSGWLNRTRVLSSLLLAPLWLMFGAANLFAWRKSGHPVGLGAMSLEVLVALLFVLRRDPWVVSRAPWAWISAGVGTFGMILARPDYAPVGGLAALYLGLQLAGAALAGVSFVVLGRSFGLVAANRGLHTRGPYALVRHPVYAGYVLTGAGYLLENPSLRNAVVLTVVFAFQLVRMRNEEECLSADPEYASYRRSVPYRLVPRVY